jgi:hypothetical protein
MSKAVKIFKEFVESQEDISIDEVFEILDNGITFTFEQKLSFGSSDPCPILIRQQITSGNIPPNLSAIYNGNYVSLLVKTWEDASDGEGFAFTRGDGTKYWFCAIDCKGRYEGAGEHAEQVIAVLEYQDPSDLLVGLVRITGFYASESGTEWDTDYDEVVPKPVTVIKWGKK